MEIALPGAEESAKAMLFHYLIGERGRQLCNTLMCSVCTAERTVSHMMAKFYEHCTPTVERYRVFLQEIKALMKQNKRFKEISQHLLGTRFCVAHTAQV